MTLFAAFICSSLGQCLAVQPRWVDQVGTPHDIVLYQSLEECQRFIRSLYRGGPAPKPDAQGRFPAQGGAWYECLARHVDTWQQP